MMAEWRADHLRRFTMLGIVLHALVLLAAPFAHHDLACHLKTPQHCTSCTANPVSPGVSAVVTAPAPALNGTDRTRPIHDRAPATPPAPRVLGRSPPSAI